MSLCQWPFVGSKLLTSNNIKGRPETAIRIARAAEMPLHIAAKVPRTERGYFKKQLEPQIDGKQVRLIGEVDENAG
jgi:hypothetical protein